MAGLFAALWAAVIQPRQATEENTA